MAIVCWKAQLWIIWLLSVGIRRSVQDVCSSDNGYCPQLCSPWPLNSSYVAVCHCYDGTKGSSCAAQPTLPATFTKTLIFATFDNTTGSSTLWKLFGNTADYESRLSDINYTPPLAYTIPNYPVPGVIEALSVDPRRSSVFIGNASNRVTFNALGGGTFSQSADISTNAQKISGLAFDWVFDNLYWTDGQRIGVSKYNHSQQAFTFKATLLDGEDAVTVRDLCIDPANYYLFWVSIGYRFILTNVTNTSSLVPVLTSYYTIIRSDLQAKNQKVMQPTTTIDIRITVDSTKHRLYMLNVTSGELGCVDYESKRACVLTPGFNRLTFLAVDTDYVFLGDSLQARIYILNKATMNHSSTFTVATSGSLVSLALFAGQTQLPNSSCAVNNGGCSHICIATSQSTRVCVCDSKYELPFQDTICNAFQDTSSKTGSTQCDVAANTCDHYADCPDNRDERTCSFPSVDTTKALIFSTHNGTSRSDVRWSTLWKLFGNPADYVPKLSDPSLSGSLPIRFNYSQYYNVTNAFSKLAADCATSTVFIGNNAQGLLERVPFVYDRNAVQSAPLTSSSRQMTSMTYDWVSKNIYWSDGQFISVSKFANGSVIYTSALPSSVSSSILDMAVDPINGYLFWVDNGQIIRADLMANNRYTMILQTASVSELAVDFPTRRVYYLDTTNGVLGYVSYDGQQAPLPKYGFTKLSTMTVYANYLFVSDYKYPVIYVLDKNSFTFVSLIRVIAQGPIDDMVWFTSDIQQSASTPCSANNSPCNHICVVTNSTASICLCDDEYDLLPDQKSCRKRPTPDPAAKAGGLACTNTDHICDYYSDCRDNSDEDNCNFPSVDMTKAVIFSTSNESTTTLWKLFGDPAQYSSKLSLPVYRRNLPLHLNYNNYNGMTDALGALAAAFGTSSVYFSNNGNKRIEFGPFVYNNGTDSPMFINVQKQVKAMAYDWLSGNLYWSDGRSIAVTSVGHDVNNCTKTVISAGLTAVQDIAVDPQQNCLFWCDAVSDGNKIVRSDLSGKNRKELALFTRASRLAVDIGKQRLYYIESDSRSIKHSRYDGQDQVALSVEDPVSTIALYGDFIFLGSSQQPVISIYNKAQVTKKVSSFTAVASGPVVAMTMFARENQPTVAGGPCSSKNGGCGHICVGPPSSSKVCLCADGFALDSDGSTCSPDVSAENSSSFPPGAIAVIVIVIPCLIAIAVVAAYCCYRHRGREYRGAKRLHEDRMSQLSDVFKGNDGSVSV